MQRLPPHNKGCQSTAIPAKLAVFAANASKKSKIKVSCKICSKQSSDWPCQDWFTCYILHLVNDGNVTMPGRWHWTTATEAGADLSLPIYGRSSHIFLTYLTSFSVHRTGKSWIELEPFSYPYNLLLKAQEHRVRMSIFELIWAHSIYSTYIYIYSDPVIEERYFHNLTYHEVYMRDFESRNNNDLRGGHAVPLILSLSLADTRARRSLWFACGRERILQYLSKKWRKLCGS